jgi:hypothetical protein
VSLAARANTLKIMSSFFRASTWSYQAGSM